jgi:hypothetical protein
MGKSKKDGKGLSVVKTANAMAGRLSSSRHQRRKLEKLAKRHPSQFVEAAKVYEQRDERK